MVKEYLAMMIKLLVDQPDQVEIREIDGISLMVFELKVGPGDLGKVIGKKGQNARAIRTLLTAVAARTGKRAVLEIIE